MKKKTKKILIVDDDQTFSAILESHLINMHFEVLIVEDVCEARDIIENNELSGLVLDMQLKSSLGTELIPDILEAPFYPIVASGYITPVLEKLLIDHRVLFYDKSDIRFNPKIIADSFAILNQNLNSNSKNVDVAPTAIPQYLTPKILPDGDDLELIIGQKLKSYNLTPKGVAYKRLLKGIYYKLKPAPNQEESIPSIYIDVMKVDYHTAFTSISRLLNNTFKTDCKPFYKLFYKKTEEEVVQLNLKEAPTPTDFIHHIVDEIKKEFGED